MKRPRTVQPVGDMTEEETSMKRTIALTAERLHELLDYDPETGVFTWRVASNNYVKVGAVAGCRDQQHGYWRIRIDRRVYKRHRLAWFYVHGMWPVADLDHIDTIRDHDWIANLREATKTQNGENQTRPHANNRSGFLGVRRARDRWRATITVNCRRIHLGVFDTPEEAYAAYVTAKRELHPYGTI